MATVPYEQPTVLPVAIQRTLPKADMEEWRLAHMLHLGGSKAAEALAAMRTAKLSPDEATDPKLQVFFARALELDAEEVPVDETTITLRMHDLELRDTLDSVIHHLRSMSYAMSDADPVQLVARIREASALRDAQRRIHHLNVLARRSDAELSSVIAAVRRMSDELQARIAPISQEGHEQTAHVWLPLVTTAHDLMRKDLPSVMWLVPNIITEGLTLLVGKPKKGKSTLALQLALALAAGGRTLGNQVGVEQCGVLYIAAEDNERRMQARIRRMLQSDDAPAALRIAYKWRRADEGGIDDLESFLDDNPDVRIVILDTYAKVRPRRAHGANLYDDDYAALDRFHELCLRRPGLALLILHHARKSGSDDPFDEVSGSLAINGVADNMLALRRQGETAELHRSGRDYDDDTVLGLRGDAHTLTWRLEGTADDMHRSAERTVIIETLRSKGDWMTPSEIAAELQKNRVTVQRLLSKLLTESRPVVMSENGRYRLACASSPSNHDSDNDSQDRLLRQFDNPPATLGLPDLRSDLLVRAKALG